jgi:hypothetical protein
MAWDLQERRPVAGVGTGAGLTEPCEQFSQPHGGQGVGPQGGGALFVVEAGLYASRRRVCQSALAGSHLLQACGEMAE